MHRLCRGPGFSSNVAACAINAVPFLFTRPKFLYAQFSHCKRYIFTLKLLTFFNPHVVDFPAKKISNE